MAACSKTTIPTLTSIAVTPDHPATLTVDYTQRFNAMGTYSDGSTTDISSQAVWASSDPNVATIENGTATGLAAGTTNITVTLDGITSPIIALTVTTLSSIAVTPNPPNSLAVGSTEQFTATGTYWDGSTQNITNQVTWASDTSATVTIDSNGLATGQAAGFANITATLSGVTSPAVLLVVVVPATTTTTTTP
jgi:hypothetical protein